jgi:hypothetical protein
MMLGTMDTMNTFTLIPIAMIKTTLDRHAARKNVIIDGKLYIPKNQTEVFIDEKDGKEKIRFTYQDSGYHWREPDGIYCTWGDDCTFIIRRFGQMLKIKNYSKMRKSELASIIWNSIIIEDN